MRFFAHFNEKGQALLIVVLVMVVALTVTLSVVSRSIVNLKTSTQQTDSQKVLAAAEAGVEQSIQSKAPVSSLQFGSAHGSTTYTDVKVSASNGNSFNL